MINEYYSYYRPDTRDGVAKEQSDVLKISNDIFVVVDGIRFFKDENLPAIDDSAIYEGAELIASSIITTISQANLQKVDKVDLTARAFVQANETLRKFNEKRGVTLGNADHYHRQLVSAVVAFGFPYGGTFYAGQISDAGLLKYNQYEKKDGTVYLDREIDLVQNQSTFARFMEKMEQTMSLTPGTREHHQYIRGQVVNKKIIHQGKVEGEVRFGVVNGDPNALEYFRHLAIKVSDHPLVLLYTDGVASAVYDEEKVKALFDAKIDQDVSQIIGEGNKKEGSLIVLKF